MNDKTKNGFFEVQSICSCLRNRNVCSNLNSTDDPFTCFGAEKRLVVRDSAASRADFINPIRTVVCSCQNIVYRRVLILHLCQSHFFQTTYFSSISSYTPSHKFSGEKQESWPPGVGQAPWPTGHLGSGKKVTCSVCTLSVRFWASFPSKLR